MEPIYLAGIDIGQTTDPSALAILEKTGARDAARYEVRHLHRFELNTPYEAVVSQTLELLSRKPLNGAALAIDQTGVGRPVVEMFRRKNSDMRYRSQVASSLYPITITAGHQATKEEDGDHVPKKDLVAVLMLLLQSARLKIAKGLKYAGLLEKELANFRAKITLAANVTYESWREGQHDDLVLALAMAAWLGNQGHGEPAEVISFGPRPYGVHKAPQGVYACDIFKDDDENDDDPQYVAYCEQLRKQGAYRVI